MAIADQIRAVLAEQGIPERELSRRARLAESHVSLLLAALEKDPLAVNLRTLDKIARAAGVSLLWLIGGGDDRVGKQSPGRDAAAALAKHEGVWPEAVRSVLAEQLAEGQADRSPEWWLLRMKQRELEMIDEAIKRREGALSGSRSRERATVPPTTVPAKSGRRRKRSTEGESAPASSTEAPEVKPSRKG